MAQGHKCVTVNAHGCGFDCHSRKLNIYLNLCFHVFALVTRQSTPFSSATQHAIPPEFGGKLRERNADNSTVDAFNSILQPHKSFLGKHRPVLKYFKTHLSCRQVSKTLPLYPHLEHSNLRDCQNHDHLESKSKLASKKVEFISRA